MDDLPIKKRRGWWHAEAIEMRARDCTFAEIAEKFGVSAPAVFFALHPEGRWHKGKIPIRKKKYEPHPENG